jgi:hypothetical protein
MASAPNAIVKNMLLHSREGSGEHRPVDINALVEEAVNLAYHGAILAAITEMTGTAPATPAATPATELKPQGTAERRHVLRLGGLNGAVCAHGP